MRKILLVAVIVVGINYSVQSKSHLTPPVKERLKLLKWQLKEEIEEKQKQYSVIPPEDDDDSLEVNTKTDLRSRTRITPLSRLKKKKLRTTGEPSTAETTEKTIGKSRDTLRETTDNVTDTDDLSDNSTENVQQLRMKQLTEKAKRWEKHLKKYGTPLEIFYRRDSKQEVISAETRNRHILLCVDLLRPILMGMKKNITQRKVYGEQVVNRLIRLLSHGSNGISHNGDEIVAILLQINSLQIRFFQWDVVSIKKFFNFIMPGQKHSFKSLKNGIKRILLHIWKMDLSNTNQLIKESRMFRPPCVITPQGSTRSSRRTRYTMPSSPKSTCSPKDKKCLVYAEEDENSS